MRFYRTYDVGRVRAITCRYVPICTHRGPLDWGWDTVQRLGIRDIGAPDFEVAPVKLTGLVLTGNRSVKDSLVLIFCGSSVTSLEAVRSARLDERVFGHSPVHMIVVDVTDSDSNCA